MDFLLGVTFNDWLELLWENKFAVDRKYIKRAAYLTAVSIRNSYYRKKEETLYKKEIEHTQVKPPVFIIGHWRSGTTLVHNLLSLDKNFAFPNLFQTTHPHSFIVLEKAVEAAFAAAEPQSRPMDNMLVTYKSPGEDESAVAVLTARSPIIGWGFNRSSGRYNKYHTFSETGSADLERWLAGFIWFLKKLSWKYKLPLVLKSPIHIARISILLKVFPEAKFIHIYRNPFTVFQSTLNLYRKLVPNMCLQNTDSDRWTNDIINNYKLMYDTFFAEKHLIPDGNLVEVRFEDIEKDIPGQMKLIYEKLHLKGFDSLMPEIENYMKSVKGYKKNEFSLLTDSLSKRIQNEWRRSFEEWGYLRSYELIN